MLFRARRIDDEEETLPMTTSLATLKKLIDSIEAATRNWKDSLYIDFHCKEFSSQNKRVSEKYAKRTREVYFFQHKVSKCQSFCFQRLY